MNRFVRLIGSFFFIITLFILLYAYAMFQGGFVSWFLFFSFLPIGFYQIILMLYPLQRWEIKRTLSHHTLRAGDSIKVSIKMKRKIPFPLFYCIVEEVVQIGRASCRERGWIAVGGGGVRENEQTRDEGSRARKVAEG